MDTQTPSLLAGVNKEARIIADISEMCVYPEPAVKVDLGVKSDEMWMRSLQTDSTKCF